jgi:hypothetical protein
MFNTENIYTRQAPCSKWQPNVNLHTYLSSLTSGYLIKFATIILPGPNRGIVAQALQYC